MKLDSVRHIKVISIGVGVMDIKENILAVLCYCEMYDGIWPSIVVFINIRRSCMDHPVYRETIRQVL